jgi:adenosylcobinamide kinase / adenosylcobinamide-phosphate guanylyltransferase
MALVVFTGGSRSGKSRAAEKLALLRAEQGTHVTVAVFGHTAHGDDIEFETRIERHQRSRPASFSTLEGGGHPEWLGRVPTDDVLIVECLGTCLGRIMEDVWGDVAAADQTMRDADPTRLPAGFESECQEFLEAVVSGILAREGDTIVVTNEVGGGLVPHYATGRYFCDALGRANRVLVSAANTAYFVVAGRFVDLTALPRDTAWPSD